MYKIIEQGPLWMGPAIMTGLNLVLLTLGFVCEGRLRVRKAQFLLLHASCILPAIRGDIEPWMRVMSNP